MPSSASREAVVQAEEFTARGHRRRLSEDGREIARAPSLSLPPPVSTSQPPAAAAAVEREGAAHELHESVQYLSHDELLPFEEVKPSERWVIALVKRLSSEDWSEQFGAIDDVRRLACFCPTLLAGDSLRKIVGAIAELTESLRSAPAKNALRCLGELFASFGRHMNLEVDVCFSAVLKRSADTNVFISAEAEITMCEVCRSAPEKPLMPLVLAAATNRQAGIRKSGVWCLAMLAQRRCAARRDAKAIAEVAEKALGDANVDVRRVARLAATVFAASGNDGALVAKLVAAALPGVDLSTFDAFDIAQVHHLAQPSKGARVTRR